MIEKDIDVLVGERLAYLRNKKGYTMRKVAEALNIDPSYISRIEKGHIPSIKILQSFAELYEVKLSDLLESGEGISSIKIEVEYEWFEFVEAMKQRNMSPEQIIKYLDTIEDVKERLRNL
jgi:XRE family transcriptional regulator, master regulator for biofilm formation